MKTLNLLLGTLFLALAISIAPVMAGAAGVALLAGAGQPAAAMPVNPAPSVLVIREPAVRVVELRGGGVVVFRTVGGKLTSRFYRA